MIALIPLPVPCGAPSVACAVPPAPPSTQASYRYEVEPLIVYLLEWMVPANIPFYYATYRK